MKYFALYFTALTIISLPAFADGWELEAGYAFVSADDRDIKVDLGALYGIVGYRWDHAQNYSSTAEVLFAVGIQSDSFSNVGVSLDPSYSVGYKGTLMTGSPDFIVYWRANYATIGAEVSGFNARESGDGSGLGLGVGAAWRGFTVGYTNYFGDLDEFSMITLGLQMK